MNWVNKKIKVNNSMPIYVIHLNELLNSLECLYSALIIPLSRQLMKDSGLILIT